MFRRYITLLYLTATAVFIGSRLTYGQGINLQSPKTYVIGGVTVSGIKNFSEKTVKSFTGLNDGELITIPGDDIPRIIKKLWDLKLFSDVNIYLDDVQGNKVYLNVNVHELPRLSDYKIEGVGKAKIKEIKKTIDLKKGKRIDKNFVANTKIFITRKFKEKGFVDTKVAISLDDEPNNTKRMYIRIDRGRKIKIRKIRIDGNDKISSKRIRKAMKNTKQRNPIRLFKRSKYVKKDYEEDLENVISLFKRNGYRDARILSDSIYRKDKYIYLDVNLEEGNKYYFGDIKFIGNAAYTNKQLTRVLGIKKGNTYNGVLLEERIADVSKPDAEDLTNLYNNNGYLFVRINPVEVAVNNNIIDMEIRISEGKLAHFNNIRVQGNTRVNDHVIYRALRTRPGQLYSKANVVRTVRELSQLNFFDQEKIEPKFENVNPNTGTLDLSYNLEGKGSSQIQLQGGYGGGSFIGTVGLSFNNFSIRNIFNPKSYRPVPLGDGQQFGLNLQVSRFYSTYSISFTEPWLGGRRPVGLSVSLYRSTNYLYNRSRLDVDKSRFFDIYGIKLGLSRVLRKPDDYFTLYQGITYNYYDLSNYNTGLFSFGDGTSNSFAYTISLGRNSSGPSPIYPMRGSKFNATLKLSPPFSAFDKTNFNTLGDNPDYKLKDSEGRYIRRVTSTSTGIVTVERVSDPSLASEDQAKTDQKKYRWLEFYKFTFVADWYLNIIDKLVLKTSADFGILNYYNKGRGLIPFERFFVGGSGLATTTLDGRQNVQLRGYQNQSLSGNDGSSIYNKFSAELRYPVTLKPSASIYALLFAEGGNAFNGLETFNPFYIKKSAGVGLRIFMPAFGLLGFDFGYGFDPSTPGQGISGWQTHFIIGQNF